MKRRNFKRIMAGFWALAVVVMSSMTALAADSVDVNGSGTSAGGTDIVVGYQDRDLFSNMKELMPGDRISNQITVANKSGRQVTIYLKAYSDFASADGETAVRDKSTASADGKTFREDILDQITMTLKLGDKILYQGSADGMNPEAGYSAMTVGDYGISLGDFTAGQQETLSVSLLLPGPELDNSFKNKFDAVDWVFCVEGTTPSDKGGGGGGHSGGGHSGGGGNPSGPGITEIMDAPVPLGDWTGSDGDDNSNIIILDPEVPLGSIPKLGDEGIGGYVFGILLAMLITCSAFYMKKRYSRS